MSDDIVAARASLALSLVKGLTRKSESQHDPQIHTYFAPARADEMSGQWNDQYTRQHQNGVALDGRMDADASVSAMSMTSPYTASTNALQTATSLESLLRAQYSAPNALHPLSGGNDTAASVIHSFGEEPRHLSFDSHFTHERPDFDTRNLRTHLLGEPASHPGQMLIQAPAIPAPVWSGHGRTSVQNSTLWDGAEQGMFGQQQILMLTPGNPQPQPQPSHRLHSQGPSLQQIVPQMRYDAQEQPATASINFDPQGYYRFVGTTASGQMFQEVHDKSNQPAAEQLWLAQAQPRHHARSQSFEPNAFWTGLGQHGVNQSQHVQATQSFQLSAQGTAGVSEEHRSVGGFEAVGGSNEWEAKMYGGIWLQPSQEQAAQAQGQQLQAPSAVLNSGESGGGNETSTSAKREAPESRYRGERSPNDDDSAYQAFKKPRAQMLNSEDAAEIYRERPALMPRGLPVCLHVQKMAEKYHVATNTVRDIWGRRTWVRATQHLWTASEEQQYKLISRKQSRANKSGKSASSGEPADASHAAVNEFEFSDDTYGGLSGDNTTRNVGNSSPS